MSQIPQRHSSSVGHHNKERLGPVDTSASHSPQPTNNNRHA